MIIPARALAFLLVSLAAFAAAGPSAQEPAVFPLEEVKPGMTATGYTVLSGETPVEFEAEVLGIQRLDISNDPMVLCRLKGERFEKSGVIAAMSGSPLYIGGRFLGAVAIGWAFAKEPICGVTPAGRMRSLYGKGASPGGGPVTERARVRDLAAFFGAMERPPEGVEELLKPLRAMGASVTSGVDRPFDGEGRVRPGDMIGAQLISGDIELAGYGTVSDVRGDSFLAFGHPFLGLGETDFPVVRASVSTVMPSLSFSFKMSSSGNEIGRMRLDSPHGIVCETGRRADTLPVEVRYTRQDGSAETRSCRIVRHKDLSRILLMVVIGSVHEQLEDNGGEMSLLLEEARFGFEGGGEFLVRNQLFGGDDPEASLNSFASELFSLLEDNPFQKPRIGSVSLSIRSRRGTDIGRLMELKASSAAVRRGDPVQLEILFAGFGRAEEKVKASIPTASLPAGKLRIVASDGLSFFRRATAASPDPPRDFPSLLRSLEGMPEGGRFNLAVFVTETPSVLDGRRVFGLPPSLGGLLPAAASPAQRPAEKLVLGPLQEGKSGFFTGEVEIEIEILERES